MRHISRTLTAAALFASVSVTAAFAWGAIAVDDDYDHTAGEAGYASVTQYPTRRAAADEAMATCQTSENKDCRLVLTFTKCGAYAASTTRWGIGTGNTLPVAENRALSDCGGPDCQIVVSDCE
jgi:hypothetical protein